MRANWLLDTPLILVEGMSQSDLDAEWEAATARARVTQQLIDGEVDWEYYFDFMAQQGYEPAELMDTAEQNLKFAIEQGISIVR